MEEIKSELKKCAQCGATPKIGSLLGDMENWSIWCEECGITCSEFETKELTITNWNTRHIPDGLEGRIVEILGWEVETEPGSGYYETIIDDDSLKCAAKAIIEEIRSQHATPKR